MVTYNPRFVEIAVKCGVGKGLCSLEELTAFVEVCMQSHFSRVRLFAIPWAVACQVLLSMGFSKQEHCSAGDRPDPGIEPWASAFQADCLPLVQSLSRVRLFATG